MASSVFFAIKDAIQSARAEIGLTEVFQLYSPATAERIRMACEDQLTRKVCTSNYLIKYYEIESIQLSLKDINGNIYHQYSTD